MRSFPVRWLIPFTLVVLLLPACSDSGDDAADTTLAPTTTDATTTTTVPEEATEPLPPEAAAVLEEYYLAFNATDHDRIAKTINPAMYEYVWAGEVQPPDLLEVRAKTLAEKNYRLQWFEQIETKLIATTEDSYFVAVTAERYDDEIGFAVNGIQVIKITNYPEKGWLIVLDYHHGL